MYSGQGTFGQKIMKIFEPETAENNGGFLSVALLATIQLKCKTGRVLSQPWRGAEKWIRERSEKHFICENITPVRSARKRWNRPAIWNFENAGVDFDWEASY